MKICTVTVAEIQNISNLSNSAGKSWKEYFYSKKFLSHDSEIKEQITNGDLVIIKAHVVAFGETNEYGSNDEMFSTLRKIRNVVGLIPKEMFDKNEKMISLGLNGTYFEDFEKSEKE